MPLPPGTKYRVKKTSKGPIRLAFMGKKVIEAKKMTPKPGGLASRMAAMHKAGKFSKAS